MGCEVRSRCVYTGVPSAPNGTGSNVTGSQTCV